MEIAMSAKELDRTLVLKNVQEGLISKVKAEKTLSLSVRQVSRLLLRLQEHGPSGLISNKRRQTKQMKPLKIRQLRARRDRFGELIQIDGSTHDCFEGRGGVCTLLVFIDDATSKLVNLMFVSIESTLSYFAAMNDYISVYGKPRAVYTDKPVVFKVNAPGGVKTTALTQFGRALKELNIEAIFAHSPEAKGRVERANNTLQNRLVKELRYFKIYTIADANKFLKQCIHEYNRKFAVEPKHPIDLHQPW